MSLVCEDLPNAAVDTLVRAGHEATTEQLRAVRQCRKVHLPWLIDLVRAGLPTFCIPSELRPVPPAPAATPVPGPQALP